MSVTPPEQKIIAEIIDAKSDKPQKSDKILLDTNVWIELEYGRGNFGGNAKTSSYANFVKNARQAKAELYVSVFTWAEIVHLIEKTECQLYSRSSRTDISIKEFRQFDTERQKVSRYVTTAWNGILTKASILGLNVNDVTIKESHRLFVSTALDSYDILIYQSMLAGSLTQILTDDRDFAGVPGITIFTANNRVLTLAEQQGKLVNR